MGRTIPVRVEEKAKKEARNNGISFSVSADVPNETTIRAIREAEKGKMKSFSYIDELMEDLND